MYWILNLLVSNLKIINLKAFSPSFLRKGKNLPASLSLNKEIAGFAYSPLK